MKKILLKYKNFIFFKEGNTFGQYDEKTKYTTLELEPPIGKHKLKFLGYNGKKQKFDKVISFATYSRCYKEGKEIYFEYNNYWFKRKYKDNKIYFLNSNGKKEVETMSIK